ncbi:MAG: amino acid racemase [Sphingobium sp.]|nr:amino acid racemase [Sphingobium sp.]
MPKHIGIVGCSAEGAALCYKSICIDSAEIMGTHAHPEISMHTLSLSDYVACLDRSDIKGVRELMLQSAHRLAACGAEFLICPDNTIHQAMDYVRPRSPLPWLHIAEIVAQEAASKGYKCPGITGTQWLVESDVYPTALKAQSLHYHCPPLADRQAMGAIIMNELVYGQFRAESINAFVEIIDRLKGAGADAVILGCTEIPLIINNENSPLPVLDSTRLLAKAAMRHSILG